MCHWKVIVLLSLFMISPVAAVVSIANPLQQEVNETNLNIAAHGDAWVYAGSDAPGDAATGWLWLFGLNDGIYGRPFDVSSGVYSVRIPADEVWSLETGVYHFYLQFAGQNQIREIEYNRLGELGSPWRNVENVSVKCFDPKTTRQYLDTFRSANPTLDDVWLTGNRVRIEEPGIRINNQYETSKGNLYLDGITNLAAGDVLRGIIDEEEVHGTYKERLFTVDATVQGEDPTQYRSWQMEFTRDNIGELRQGQHNIGIHLPTGQVATTSFNVIMRVIPPTPTPIIEYAYSVTGVLLYQEINTTSRYNYTEAHAVNATVATTPRPSVTEAIPDKLGNRTIAQGMAVYIGEDNLDIWPALGWANTSSGDYFIAHWNNTADYYALPSDVLLVEDPTDFDVDNRFAGMEGEWYQWVGWYEPKTPVAFVVKRLPQVYNVTIEPTAPPITEAATTGSATPTPPPETTRPVPTKTEMQVNIPLPWWVAVAALLILVMRRR